jgi:hypothetical protein
MHPRPSRSDRGMNRHLLCTPPQHMKCTLVAFPPRSGSIANLPYRRLAPCLPRCQAPCVPTQLHLSPRPLRPGRPRIRLPPPKRIHRAQEWPAASAAFASCAVTARHRAGTANGAASIASTHLPRERQRHLPSPPRALKRAMVSLLPLHQAVQRPSERRHLKELVVGASVEPSERCIQPSSMARIKTPQLTQMHTGDPQREAGLRGKRHRCCRPSPRIRTRAPTRRVSPVPAAACLARILP